MSLPFLLSVIALVVSIFAIVSALLCFKRLTASQGVVSQQASDISEIQRTTTNLSHELHEIRSGNFALMAKVKDLANQVEQLHSAQQSLAQQDPQVRFYSNAAKLIGQGASIEQVMSECDIPRAEAELLFNLHAR